MYLQLSTQNLKINEQLQLKLCMCMFYRTEIEMPSLLKSQLFYTLYHHAAASQLVTNTNINFFVNITVLAME